MRLYDGQSWYEECCGQESQEMLFQIMLAPFAFGSPADGFAAFAAAERRFTSPVPSGTFTEDEIDSTHYRCTRGPRYMSSILTIKELSVRAFGSKPRSYARRHRRSP